MTEASSAAWPEPEQVAARIRAAAENEILPRFGHLKRSDIREKSPGQLVTEADVAAERVLSRTLTELLPAPVVGEEAVAEDDSLLQALDQSGPVWVIDPVDGTANFAGGNPRFAVIVALVVDGHAVMGWIHDPIPNRTVFAARGRGCWLGPIRLATLTEVPLDEMEGSVKNRKARVARRVRRIARLGSAAHDYLDLVTGRLHFAHFHKLMPWDHAAGVLIHAEAGGFSALGDGKPYRARALPRSSLLLAPGRASWEALLPLIE